MRSESSPAPIMWIRRVETGGACHGPFVCMSLLAVLALSLWIILVEAVGAGGSSVSTGNNGNFNNEVRLMLIANRKDIRALEVERNISKVVVDKTNEAVALSFVYSAGMLDYNSIQ